MPAALHGVLLQDYVARQFAHLHATVQRRLLADGRIRVNGMRADRNRRLRSHDAVQVDVPEASRERRTAPPRELAVLRESGHWLVVDKPPGLPTVPDRAARAPSVHGLLEALRPGADLRIVHRLDRDTSGCLLLAKGLAAARHFDQLFRSGGVHKEYRALVHGAMNGSARVVELPLGPDPRRPGKVVVATRPTRGARAARTAVQVIDAFAAFTHVRLLPATGRSHQLRVHLAAIGHPIVGDADYGGEALLLSRLKPGYKLRRGVAERPLLARTFLHAASVRFRDLDGGEVTVAAPLPADLQVALRQVARAAGRRS